MADIQHNSNINPAPSKNIFYLLKDHYIYIYHGYFYDYMIISYSHIYIYLFSTIAQPSLTHTMSLFCHAPRMLSESAYWEIKFQHRTAMNLLRAPFWQRNIFGESIKIVGLTSKNGLWTKQFNGMGILTSDATSKSEILYQIEWLSNLISHRISSVKTLEASSVSNHMSSLVLVRITLWVIIYDIYIYNKPGRPFSATKLRTW